MSGRRRSGTSRSVRRPRWRPIVVRNMIFTGISGGELGVRGRLVALDLKSGKISWEAYNTGPDKDARIGPDFKAFYAKDQGKDLGVKSWTPGQWKVGGGAVWGWVSYDPELNLIYYGTGNPGVWNPDMRPGDNKWSMHDLGADPETGMAKWAYQVVPHDAWDYDEIMENILVDMPWQGQMRKLLLHPGRTGFMFVLDRETGEVLSAEKFEPSNWANSYNLKTGPAGHRHRTKRTHFGHYCDPYLSVFHRGERLHPFRILAANRVALHSRPQHLHGLRRNGGELHRRNPIPRGERAHVSRATADTKESWLRGTWRRRKRFGASRKCTLPVYSGVLATGGDLVFYGTMDGLVSRARCAHRQSSMAVQDGVRHHRRPDYFLGPDGKQYVAIYSGIGGWMGATALPDVSTDDPYAALGAAGAMKKIKGMTQPGDLLYVFGF